MVVLWSSEKSLQALNRRNSCIFILKKELYLTLQKTWFCNTTKRYGAQRLKFSNLRIFEKLLWWTKVHNHGKHTYFKPLFKESSSQILCMYNLSDENNLTLQKWFWVFESLEVSQTQFFATECCWSLFLSQTISEKKTGHPLPKLPLVDWLTWCVEISSGPKSWGACWFPRGLL